MSDDYETLISKVREAKSFSEVDDLLEMSPSSRESWAASIVWEALKLDGAAPFRQSNERR